MKSRPRAVALVLGAALCVWCQSAQPLDWPILGWSWESSPFGPRTAFRTGPRGGQTSAWHDGADEATKVGTRLIAIAAGTIAYASAHDPVYGRVLVLKTAWRGLPLYVRYAHLSHIWVDQGERVAQGQALGLSGNSGESTGPHLHIQVMVDIDDLMAAADDRVLWEARR